MEKNKKDYLFRLGPLVFFPKDTGEKSPADNDTYQGFRNIIRFGIIVVYGQLSYYLTQTYDKGGIIAEDSPVSMYVLFAFPFVISLYDVYLAWLRKKIKTPINKLSRYLIYGAWLVSALFYTVCIVNTY